MPEHTMDEKKTRKLSTGDLYVYKGASMFALNS
jgi:hypothetical protein